MENRFFDLTLMENQIFLAVVFVMSTAAALHVLVYKRNARSAFGWLGLILVSPLIGAIVYYLFGINRISDKLLRKDVSGPVTRYDYETRKRLEEAANQNPQVAAVYNTGNYLGYNDPAWACITPYYDGGNAYVEMLAAIETAQVSITLCSYIFHLDEVGKKFIDALIRAHQRGVVVRVLIDAVGSNKKQLRLLRRFKKAGISARRFLPVLMKTHFSNLRNHRKILVVDGVVGFTGGLNIGRIYWPEIARDDTVLDFHCRLTGPIVSQLQQVFVDDWYFVTREELQGPNWFPEPGRNDSSRQDSGHSDSVWHNEDELPDNAVLTRLICDGPIYSEERILWHFLNAINAARHHIRIITPYFLPPESLIAALCSASMRGVRVDIVTPLAVDHVIMRWALQGSAQDLLEKGCHLWRTPAPFDHTKLLLIDDTYVSFGSSNWDARSLRLNFEVNIEYFDLYLARKLIAFFEHKRSRAARYTLEDLNSRRFWVKVRDGAARILTPYL
ncbi:Major cardiolipin synthase ClsA [BD1-7 clade bacterium]|uniref:Major cardiolipin synthase ClsA n=1 Tax=BD1-7 clade bacterium TaxID=2029982 RepID=A0A5S9NNU8_9GAMM|nr:Major cardiolipin synthase ClsA [BD1-7 clade bacterium]